MSCKEIVSFICAVSLLPFCNATNIKTSIETTITCGSYISGATYSSNDIDYYLFNKSMNEYNETYSVLFDLCPLSNPSTFDTIIYIYDQNLSIIDYNDNGDACPGYQSQIVYHLSYDEFIVGITGKNSEFGIYFLNVSCEIHQNAIHPTIFATTVEPSFFSMLNANT